MRVGVNYINKSNFLLAYLTAYIEALTLNTIRSRFVATRLVPYNLKYILLKLNT